MTMDFRDFRNGFRHREVIRFINEEILSNGGSPDFFISFRSRTWNKVEDQLQAILMNPQVPRNIKRACTWSALALALRLAFQERGQQTSQVRRLQEQMEQREVATWAQASELQRLREDHKEMASQLRCTLDTIQQVLQECKELRQRLFQAEKLVQMNLQIMAGFEAKHREAMAWPQYTAEQDKEVAEGAQGELDVEAQKEEASTGIHAGVGYKPGHLSPGAQVVQPPMPMRQYNLFSCPTSFPVGFPYLPRDPPTVDTESEAAATAVLPQVDPGRIYTHGLQAAGKSQEEMAPLSDQRSHDKEEGAVKPTFINPFENTWSQGEAGKRLWEQSTWPPKAPENSHDSEGAGASWM